MKNFRYGKLSEALQLLKGNSVMFSVMIDSLEVKIVRDQQKISEGYGKKLSYQFIEERKVKDFIARRYYLLGLINTI